jgi:transposase
MLGNQDKWQEDLFVGGSLSSLIPDDHILKKVNKILDLTWLREEVKELYSEAYGRPSIAPESAIRLMLAGFFHGIIYDRKLMREAQVNIAIRWFAGYRLNEKLPDHSSLTRIRQRWGQENFKKIFQRSVKACIEAGLVEAETVHIDATMIRADVSWESISEKHIEKVIEKNKEEDSVKSGDKDNSKSRSGQAKKKSKTDPDASLATGNRNYRMEASYKQHTAVDDKCGVILDVEATTGEENEGKKLIGQIESVEKLTGQKIKKVTADSGYAHGKNYKELEDRGIQAIIPPPKEKKQSKRIPVRRFKYDSKHKIVKCAMGKILEQKSKIKHGYVHTASAKACRKCRLKKRCISETAKSRTIVIVNGFESLLRARRERGKWPDEKYEMYKRHRWQVEGRHGEAKTQYGLNRAIRRGIENVAIQVYLTAAVMNLKRIAAQVNFLFRIFLTKINIREKFKLIYKFS